MEHLEHGRRLSLLAARLGATVFLASVLSGCVVGASDPQPRSPETVEITITNPYNQTYERQVRNDPSVYPDELCLPATELPKGQHIEEGVATFKREDRRSFVQGKCITYVFQVSARS